MTKIRKKVWQNKSNKQKLVTIPSTVDIVAGDFVLIEKEVNMENKNEKNKTI